MFLTFPVHTVHGENVERLCLTISLWGDFTTIYALSLCIRPLYQTVITFYVTEYGPN